MHLAELLQRASILYANKTATLCANRQYTWSELTQRVAKLATGLVELGLVPGARVAILAHNSDHFMQTQFATLWARGVALPLNTGWNSEELLFVLNETTPKLLLVDQHFVETALALLKRVNYALTLVVMDADDPLAGITSSEDLIQQSRPMALAKGDKLGEELAAIFYTGGTTGFPKGVMLSHSALFHSGVYSSIEMGCPYEERTLHVAPMFHMADGSQFVRNTLLGQTQYFVSEFAVEPTLAIIASHAITTLTLLPGMLQQLLEYADFQLFDLSSLRRIVYGDEPVSTSLMHQMARLLPHVALFKAYGLTEMAPLVSILSPQDHHIASRNQSVGRPIIGVKVKIVDDHFAPLPQGRHGHVLVSGKNIMTGYWHRPAQTAQTLRDGWLVTGDFGYVDQDGYLFICDRTVDIINTQQQQVFSQKVENVLLSHPAVSAAAVIGLPDEKAVTQVHAIVILAAKQTCNEQELLAYCAAHLSPPERPQSIDCQHKALPLSALGKIRKDKLRNSHK